MEGRLGDDDYSRGDEYEKYRWWFNNGVGLWGERTDDDDVLEWCGYII